MKKELPYFKFKVLEWMSGAIVLEDLETQGLFINICAFYWKKQGDVSMDEISKRYANYSERLAKLSPRFIAVQNGKMAINFLDEQLAEQGHKSNINAINGSKGGRAKALKTKGVTANDKRTVSESVAKRSNIEKDKEEDKDKDIKRERFVHPTLEEVILIFIKKAEFNWTKIFAEKEANKFWNYYESNGWKVGKNKMKSLPGAIGGWISRTETQTETTQTTQKSKTSELLEQAERLMHGK